MEEHDVIIIGAGLTGIYQLHRLREAGFDAIVDRGGRRARRHLVPQPLSRLPVRLGELHLRLLLLDRELLDEWHWKEHFSSQPENLKYLNHVADRFELQPHMRFGCRVETATYDEDERTLDGRHDRRSRRSAAAS